MPKFWNRKERVQVWPKDGVALGAGKVQEQLKNHVLHERCWNDCEIIEDARVLSARARARALGQASQSWGAWPPARSKKTTKTSSYARARWNLANFKLWFSSNFVCSWGTPCLCAVPYGRACSLRSAHFHWNMRVLERKSWSNLFCSSRPPCLWAGPYGRSCSVRYVDFHWKMSVFKG